MSEFPEHDKMLTTKGERAAVGDFLEWAEENGLQLMAVDDGRPYGVDWQAKLAQWLGIDLAELEREKRAMLAKVNETHKES